MHCAFAFHKFSEVWERETKKYKTSLVAEVEMKCDNLYVEKKLSGQNHVPPNFPQTSFPRIISPLLFFLLREVPAPKAEENYKYAASLREAAQHPESFQPSASAARWNMDKVDHFF